jgi:hypothetical protein
LQGWLRGRRLKLIINPQFKPTEKGHTMRHLLIPALFALATPALAHAPAIGPNGGLRLHWGANHYELKPAGNSVSLYVMSANGDKPVDAGKAKATGRLLIGGKLVPVTFTPAGGNRMTAPGALTGNWQAQVVVTMPGQQPATLKFSEKQRADVAAAAKSQHSHQDGNAHSH